MENYRLEYFLYGFTETHVRKFSADSRATALEIATDLLVAKHEADGQFIHLNDKTGSLTIGAGHWQRRGSFSLTLSP